MKKVILFILMMTFNIVLVSCIQKFHTVTFDFNERDKERYSIKVKHLEVISDSMIPNIEEDNFLYWEFEDKKFNFRTKVDKDITLKAKWNDIEEIKVYYKVTFNTDGGTKIDNINVLENSSFKQPIIPTKSGYIFVGWFLNDLEYNFNNKVTSDLTLTSKWEKIEENEIYYTIIFDSNGGSIVNNNVVLENTKVSIPTNPIRNGYVFLGWFYNESKFNFDTVISQNITLRAQWQKKDVLTFTATFDSNGGNKIEDQTVIKGEKIDKPTNPTKDGFVFIGWYLNNISYNFNEQVLTNLTLVAMWSEINDDLDVGEWFE